MGADHAWTADEIAHELDMLVFSLEQAPAEERERLVEERKVLRRKLEALRERTQTLRDALK